MAETPAELTARGRAESEALREQRVTNYAVKKGHGFACAVCGRDLSVLVVRDGDGLTTRCENCIGDLEPTPGQWIEGSS